MSLPVLLRILEWLYTTQSLIGLALSAYASWDTYQDLVAAHGGSHYTLHRLIVLQGYALAAALGILHVLLLFLGVQALLGALPPPERQLLVARIIVAYVLAQFAAISLQSWVLHLRRRVRDAPD